MQSWTGTGNRCIISAVCCDWLSVANYLCHGTCISLIIKGRSPYNGRLSDFSFYIDSQISAHRKFKK